MAEKLEPGWYWVKWPRMVDWEVSRVLVSSLPYPVWTYGDGTTARQPALIGPRITPPADSGEAGRG